MRNYSPFQKDVHYTITINHHLVAGEISRQQINGFFLFSRRLSLTFQENCLLVKFAKKSNHISTLHLKECLTNDDEFRFNDASTHEGHLRQNGELTWFCNETIIMISHKCKKNVKQERI